MVKRLRDVGTDIAIYITAGAAVATALLSALQYREPARIPPFPTSVVPGWILYASLSAILLLVLIVILVSPTVRARWAKRLRDPQVIYLSPNLSDDAPISIPIQLRFGDRVIVSVDSNFNFESKLVAHRGQARLARRWSSWSHSAPRGVRARSHEMYASRDATYYLVICKGRFPGDASGVSVRIERYLTPEDPP